MRKFLIVAACATALSPILSAPALATPVYDTPSTDVTPAMTNACNAYLANLNTIYAPRTFTSVEVEYVTYAVLVDPTPYSSVEIAGTRTPIGAQTGANAFGATANLANGKSPNIFTTNAKAVYAGGSNYQTNDTYHTKIIYNFFCTPTELVPGEDETRLETEGECASRVAKLDIPQPGQYCKLEAGNRLEVTVPGEPTEEVVTSLSYGIELAPIAGTATDVGTGTDLTPWTDPNSAVQAVVCISPTKNPGTWRGANGYTGPCSKDLYLQLNAAGTPSNSLPTV